MIFLIAICGEFELMAPNSLLAYTMQHAGAYIANGREWRL